MQPRPQALCLLFLRKILLRQPRATSRVLHVTVFCARKASRAPGDEAGRLVYLTIRQRVRVVYERIDNEGEA